MSEIVTITYTAPEVSTYGSYDFLQLSRNANFLAVASSLFANPQPLVVEFSDTVVKVNKRNVHQNRQLVLTNSNLAIFHSTYNQAGVRRCALIQQITGITHVPNEPHVLLHIHMEHDIRLISTHKIALIDCLNSLIPSLNVKVLESVPLLLQSQILKSDVGRKPRSSPNKTCQPPDPTSNFSNRNSPIVTYHSPILASTNLTTPEVPFASSVHRRVHSSEALSSNDTVNGWLSKRGSSGNSWRRQYFRLIDHTLNYYQSRMKNSIKLDSSDFQIRMYHQKGANFSPSSPPSNLANLQKIINDQQSLSSLLKHSDTKSTADVHFYMSVNNFYSLFNSQMNQTYSQQQQSLPVTAALNIIRTFLLIDAPLSITILNNERLNLINAYHSNSVTIQRDMFEELFEAVTFNLTQVIIPAYLKQTNGVILNDSTSALQATPSSSSVSKFCTLCLNPYSLFNRRSQCHNCRETYCVQCLPHDASVLNADDERLCNECYSIVTSYPNNAFLFSCRGIRPLHLSCSNINDTHEWMEALSYCVEGSVSQVGSPTTAANHSPSYSTSFSPVCQLNQRRSRNHLSVCPPLNKEGWMLHFDSATLHWRRRYFVLCPLEARLYIYDLVLNGSIPLIDSVSICEMSERKPTLTHAAAIFGGTTSHSDYSYRFNITLRDKLYLLAADTESEQQAWIRHVQIAINSHQSPSFSHISANSQLIPSIHNSLVSDAPIGEIALVFTDVESSTRLWESVGDGMNNALELHDAILRQLMAIHRAYEVKAEGDAFMCSFFKVSDAVKWCLAVQHALVSLEWPSEILSQSSAQREMSADGKSIIYNGLRVRMGIHVGCPQSRRNPVINRLDYFGPVVNRAARVADSAHGGQIVVTDEAMSNLKSYLRISNDIDATFDELGWFEYKGIAEKVRVWCITDKQLSGRIPFKPLRVAKGTATNPKNLDVERELSSISASSFQSGNGRDSAKHDEDADFDCANRSSISDPDQEPKNPIISFAETLKSTIESLEC